MLERFEEITEKEVADNLAAQQVVKVCVAAGCLSSQSAEVKAALIREVNGRACKVKGVGCLGLCSQGPLVAVESHTGKGDTLYQNVKPADAAEIMTALDDAPVARLHCRTDIPFFQRQHKIVLENSGQIDPERIEEYIAAEGYRALLTAVTEMTPFEVIDQVTRSGLRGRGGGGYPTGLALFVLGLAQAVRVQRSTR